MSKIEDVQKLYRELHRKMKELKVSKYKRERLVEEFNRRCVGDDYVLWGHLLLDLTDGIEACLLREWE
jgi:hypothetical protein